MVTVSKSVSQGIYMSNTLGNVSFDAVTITDCHTNTPELITHRTANFLYFSECPSITNLQVENSVFKRNSNAGFDNYKNISRHSTFSLAGGLSIVIYCDNVNVSLHNVTMDKNHGGNGGNLAFELHNDKLWKLPPIKIQDSTITAGRAIEGGGMFLLIVAPSRNFSNQTFSNNHHKIFDVRSTTFGNNSARYLGGAIAIRQKESIPLGTLKYIIVHLSTTH